MLRKLWALLIGCNRCPEKDARIASLEKRLGDLQDRFMSRDYGAYIFAKNQDMTFKKEVEMVGKGRETLEFGDGLD